MFKQTLSNVSSVGLTCLLLLFAYVSSVSAQSRMRGARTTPAKTRTAGTPSSAAAPAVISRYIEALKKRDFKTVIDLSLNDQREIAGIKASNPRALWPKLIDDYYQRRIANLTEASSLWGDRARSTLAMIGDPAQNVRAILYFLPPSCKWTVSEIRNQNKLSVVYDQYRETTVYITVDYPQIHGSPMSSKHFLKQIMLEIPVYAANQSIMNIYTVKGTEVIWQKPYPESATCFLVNKYKAEVLSDDRDTIRNAIKELFEIAGQEAVESYLLEVIDRQGHEYPRFDLALEYLAERHVKKAVPAILKALGNPDYSDQTNSYCDKSNLLQALERIGKTEFSNEAVSMLKERISFPYLPHTDDSCLNLRLRALASVEDNKEWLSFPYRAFTPVLEEISEKWLTATVIDHDSPRINQTNAFLRDMKSRRRVNSDVRRHERCRGPQTKL